MSRTGSVFKIQVEYDPGTRVYQARPGILDKGASTVREVVKRLIASGELGYAGFDIANGGGFAFIPGVLADQAPTATSDNPADLCEFLARHLNEACAPEA